MKLELFGESHSEFIGFNLNGFPENFEIDFENIKSELFRRSPSDQVFSTSRREPDEYSFISGVKNGKTNGGTVTGIIKNIDIKSSDYSDFYPRPSHADYPAYVKYGEIPKGGGVFSGRMTAPLVFAGAIVKQLLKKDYCIEFLTHIKSIKNIYDSDFGIITDLQFPVFDKNAKEKMLKIIQNAKNNNDSVGGIVETIITGVPLGFGQPLFHSLESTISSYVFAVPAVKGIEFGDGFEITKLLGSEANDQMRIENKTIKLVSNHNGGILGGLATGAAIIVRAGIKPTPSIGKEQKTVNIKTMKNHMLKINGRHDICIVPRGAVAIESAIAMGIFEYI